MLLTCEQPESCPVGWGHILGGLRLLTFTILTPMAQYYRPSG